MSFTLSTSRCKYISDILDTCSSVIQQGNIVIKSDGLYISGMDSMHVSLISLELSRHDFDEYNLEFLENTNNISIGVNLDEFVKILKTYSSSDHLTLSYSQSPKLDIILSNDGLKRKYSLKLIDLDIEDIKLPSIDYYLELNISSPVLSNIINSVSVTGAEAMKFSIENKQLITSSLGNLSDTEFIFSKNISYENKNRCKINVHDHQTNTSTCSNKIYELISCEGEFSCLIGMSLLKRISKANSLVPYVMCNLSPNTPLRLDYELNDRGSVLYYYISPKID